MTQKKAYQFIDEMNDENVLLTMGKDMSLVMHKENLCMCGCDNVTTFTVVNIGNIFMDIIQKDQIIGIGKMVE